MTLSLTNFLLSTVATIMVTAATLLFIHLALRDRQERRDLVEFHARLAEAKRRFDYEPLHGTTEGVDTIVLPAAAVEAARQELKVAAA